MPASRNEIVVEVARLNHFLRNNQLVQAHAIVQKVEVMIQRVMLDDCSRTPEAKAENHPYFEAYTQVLQVKSCILSGKTTDGKIYCEGVGKFITGNT